MANVNLTTGELQYLLSTWYDSKLLEQAKQKFVLWNQVDHKPMPKNAGKIVKWSRYSLLGPVNEASESATPDIVALSAVNVTATLIQFTSSTKTSDLLTLTAIDPQIESAVEQLSYQVAITLDTYVRNVALGLTGGVSSTNQDVAGPGQSNNSLIRLIHSGNTNLSGLVAANSMDVAEILNATNYLRTLNAPEFEDGFYHGVMHPKVEKDVLADSTAVVSWAAWNQSTAMGQEKMERGMIGNIMGVKFFRSTNMWFHNSGTSGSTISAYYTPIFGKGAVGVVDIDGAVKTYVVQGADSGNPAATFSLVSFKVTTAARVLNPSFGVILITA